MKKTSSKKTKLLWITDPWETLDHPRDTSLRLAEEAMKLGIQSFWCNGKTIRWEIKSILLDAQEFQGIFPGRNLKDFRMGPSSILSPGDFTQLIYRVDPPVDLAYLQPLQILLLNRPKD